MTRMDRGKGSWEPLWQGPDAARGIDSCHRMAGQIIQWSREEDPGRRADLFCGKSGAALFLGYMDKAFPDHGYGTSALELVREAQDEFLKDPSMGMTLANGAVGIGWTLEHLERELGLRLDAPHDLRPILDEVVLHIQGSGNPGLRYGLSFGEIGFLAYFRERGQPERLGASSDRFLSRLESQARRSSRGLSWFTPPEQLVGWELQGYPNGHFSLGLANGIPGILAALGALSHNPRAVALLEEAAPWILSFDPREPIPNFLLPDELPSPASTWGWCYGDPGAAVGMCLSGHEEIKASGRLRAQACSTGRVDGEDPTFCHGLAGTGHLFNRFHHWTGGDAFRTAADWHLRKLMKVLEEPQGWSGMAERPMGLVYGLAGIGLSILAASSDLPPAWDRVLLLSRA